MRIYDVTVPISELMPVWPGDPPVKIERVAERAAGAAFNISRLHLGSHTGTHVDAPLHFVSQGQTVDRLPLDILIGPALVLDMEDLAGKTIHPLDLAGLHPPRSATRLLLKTRNSMLWADRQNEFEPGYIHLHAKAAAWLVKRGIRLLGVDYLSVEAFRSSDYQVHQTLLEAGIVIVEGLDLSAVPPGPCQLVCLPLKIEGGDGAPARVVVIRD